uniref:Adrenomedullin n=1 Tax=Naja naja TaxID=35670 RepID=A0A8C6X4L8_NAJNA
RAAHIKTPTFSYSFSSRNSVPGHRVPRQLLASGPARGCHLGTCQLQNLANLLYRYGGNNQKEESHKNNKGTNDPMGYGRRKRRARNRLDDPSAQRPRYETAADILGEYGHHLRCRMATFFCLFTSISV